MFCPICKSFELVMAERQGIEIDYCPNCCRGVWLDRGELDKIIERSTRSERAPLAPSPEAAHHPERYHDHSGEHHREHAARGHQAHSRSFSKELFD